MLPARYRLQRKRDFDRVYQGGKTLRTALFRISTISNDLPHSRFGFVVANSVLKKAVARSRKKRQMRAAMQGIVSRVREGYDVIIAAQPGCVDASYEEIEAALVAAFQKIGFIE